MRAVVQRVSRARILVDGSAIGEMGRGLFVLVGMKKGDTLEDLSYIVKKVTKLRIFEDEQGKMNLSVQDVGGELAIVSQFTLYADTRAGNRPSWSEAMPVEEAREFWPKVEDAFSRVGIRCIFGKFQEMMDCEIVNSGPVTIVIDSADRLRSRRSKQGQLQ